MVPICYEHAAYASGLTLHQHRKYLEEFHRLKRGRAPRDVDELFDIRRTLTPALQELHERRKKHSTAIRLARFFSSIGRKFRHSTIVSMPASEAASAERINFEDPFTARPVDHGSSWSPPPTGANPKKLYRIGTSAMETDDPVRGDLDAWSESASPEIKTPSRFNPDPTDQLEKWSAEHFDPSQFDDEGE
jgi:putative transposase